MNKMILAVVLVGVVVIGHRQFAAARAFGQLEVVPTEPQGTGGLVAIRPRQPLSAYVEPGRHTVFIFSANWCPACRSLEAQLPNFLRLRPDVAVRVIDVDDPASVRAAVQGSDIEVHGIPHLVIYNAAGEVVAQDGRLSREGAKVMAKWMTAEFQKASGAGQ